ncbi:MAG: hypothetical protein LBH96_02745 [Candidatus Peribacteria bacterium]|nr:hypothetical protein [Candidatus Peribacteria bacterium]
MTQTLPNLIEAATEVNDLYLSGKGYPMSNSTTELKIKSTVLDTKRLLALVKSSKI